MVFGYHGIRRIHFMKNLGKIALYDLPKALQKALLQQLGSDTEDVLALSGKEALLALREPLDLLICPERAETLPELQDYPGTPALVLDTSKPKRLGVILRQALQMLAEPALYLEEFRIGPYLFHPPERTLEGPEQGDITLTDKEADILVYLAKRRGRAVSRDDLLKNVWRYQEGVDTHTLETHIYRLRQKMEAAADRPALLVTEEGGYRLNF